VIVSGFSISDLALGRAAHSENAKNGKSRTEKRHFGKRVGNSPLRAASGRAFLAFPGLERRIRDAYICARFLALVGVQNAIAEPIGLVPALPNNREDATPISMNSPCTFSDTVLESRERAEDQTEGVLMSH
jgi:hypothetical protein